MNINRIICICGLAMLCLVMVPVLEGCSNLVQLKAESTEDAGGEFSPDEECLGSVDSCGVCGGSGELTWYQDSDGDGLGDPAVSTSSCTQPEGYVATNSDNNDDGDSDENDTYCQSNSFDECKVCDGDNSSCSDCAGVVNGPALEDACGVCDSDSSNDNSSCADCAGEANGPSLVDDCGVCDEDPSNDNSSCADCAGVANGTAVIDNCSICVVGNTGLTACVQDCSGDWGGSNTPSLWYIDEDGDGQGENNQDPVSNCDQPPGYVADNLDLCPSDQLKADLGICGCGIQDTDNNLDSIISYQDCYQAPVFNGIDSRIIVTPLDTSFEMQTLTLEAWIELPDLNRNHKNTIISYGYGTELQASQGYVDRQSEESFALTYRSNSSEHRIRFRLKGMVSIIDLLYVVPAEYRPYGNPLHIAVSWDGTTAILYLNGIQSSTAVSTSSNKQIYYESIDVSRLYIGNWFGNNERYFKGLISDVRVWDTVRTESEIQGHYRESLEVNESGLVGYFPLNGLNFENTSLNSTTTSNSENIISDAHTTD